MKTIHTLRRLMENQAIVEQLQYAVSEGPRAIDLLLSSLEQAIDQNAWAERIDNRMNQQVAFQEMLAFVTTEPLAGLGTDVETLRHLIGDTMPVRRKFEESLTRPKGGQPGNQNASKSVEGEEETNHTNVIIRSPPPAVQGNTLAYAIRTLSSKRPDLMAKVEAGAMSANAAMIEGGFRKESTPLDTLRRAWSQASPEERETFRREMG